MSYRPKVPGVPEPWWKTVAGTLFLLAIYSVFWIAAIGVMLGLEKDIINALRN